MDIAERQRRLLALCAIRVDRQSVDWSLIARQAQLDGGLDRLWAGEIAESSSAAEKSRSLLAAGLADRSLLEERVEKEVAAATNVGARLVTVLDPDYPATLRLIPNLPPFLFYRGQILPADARSVAVVGTRDATQEGLGRARRMSGLLVQAGVTVVSGLARGIDSSAHQAAVDAGGRTIAVLGTGICKCYPPENQGLGETITEHGALVSQFWPTGSPGRDTFPRRNVVTSGISQGTVVIEASSTSGAKMQARLALGHGKQVFLVRSLVTEQKWAQDYLTRGAIEVGDVGDVIERLASAERIQSASEQRQDIQLSLL